MENAPVGGVFITFYTGSSSSSSQVSVGESFLVKIRALSAGYLFWWNLNIIPSVPAGGRLSRSCPRVAHDIAYGLADAVLHGLGAVDYADALASGT